MLTKMVSNPSCRSNAPYRPRPSQDRLKVKNPESPSPAMEPGKPTGEPHAHACGRFIREKGGFGRIKVIGGPGPTRDRSLVRCESNSFFFAPFLTSL